MNFELEELNEDIGYRYSLRLIHTTEIRTGYKVV